MICDYCGKDKASFHFIKIFDNDDVEKLNLCKDCTKNINSFSEEDFFGDFAKVLSKIFDTGNKFYQSNYNKKFFGKVGSLSSKECPNCKINLETIKEIGRVGCPMCYQYFRDELFSLIEIIHGSIEHRGKIPINSGRKLMIEKEIKDLMYRLKEEIVIENFEEAGKLRDRIKMLQKELYLTGKRSSENK